MAIMEFLEVPLDHLNLDPDSPGCVQFPEPGEYGHSDPRFRRPTVGPPPVVPVAIQMPDRWESDTDLPVLFLLHQGPGCYFDWFDRDDVQVGPSSNVPPHRRKWGGEGLRSQAFLGFPGFIVVPDGAWGWYTDWYDDVPPEPPDPTQPPPPRPPGRLWKTHLDKVIDALNARYGSYLSDDRTQHAIAGVSIMGGYAAITYAASERGRDYFGSAASFSGVLSLQESFITLPGCHRTGPTTWDLSGLPPDNDGDDPGLQTAARTVFALDPGQENSDSDLLLGDLFTNPYPFRDWFNTCMDHYLTRQTSTHQFDGNFHWEHIFGPADGSYEADRDPIQLLDRFRVTPEQPGTRLFIACGNGRGLVDDPDYTDFTSGDSFVDPLIPFAQYVLESLVKQHAQAFVFAAQRMGIDITVPSGNGDPFLSEKGRHNWNAWRQYFRAALDLDEWGFFDEAHPKWDWLDAWVRARVSRVHYKPPLIRGPGPVEQQGMPTSVAKLASRHPSSGLGW